MKVGDLVWHIDDVKDDMNIPGLVVYVCSDEYDARVRFTDRTFDETHVLSDLTRRPVFHEDENIMGNPDA